jgi:predicted phosphoribosyltransferase
MVSTISQHNNNDNGPLFADRTHAATLLAEKLKVLINKTLGNAIESKERQQQLLTLAIPRGGVEICIESNECIFILRFFK